MPRSKHRRKAGGKSVRHPGRGNLPYEPPLSPAWRAWKAFRNAYCWPFHQHWPNHPAGDLLDTVSDVLFDPDTRSFQTADKSECFLAFLQPFEDEDGSPVMRTLAQAEAAMAFLVEHNMVVVEDELISIHSRFADVLNPPRSEADANKGQVSTS